MLRQILAPIHPDGWKFVASGAVITVVLWLLWAPLGWLALIATLWIAYFFRDPWRVTPDRAGIIVAPADGLIVAIGPAPPPPELDMGSEPVPRIGIFLNLLDVHVARAPAGGTVTAARHIAGRFVNANLDKASEHNERLALRIAPVDGPPIAFVLIAGLVARRIVCGLRVGQIVTAGERIGIIRFGSRADVYCPPPYLPVVAIGQRTVAGETVLADRAAAVPVAAGIAH
ncbi:MAG TPA: phosphatidylserine decarboxylase [Stellaceae bacterium]|jgi:phosphatidylserine decarboxylase|nr:phosphatidylserine decarboxylase [Stellaceae bacterium]